MDAEPDDRVCVRRGCAQRGMPTTAERCTACNFRTQTWDMYRPDPDEVAELAERFDQAPAPRTAQQPGVGLPVQRGVRVAGQRGVLIVTTNEIPGYDIVEVHGDVFGLTVRARDYFSNMGARVRTVVGGEVGGYTKLLAESRDEARERLAEAARRTGANAVLAMRFDCNEIGGIMNEIAAYGTAVTIVKRG